MASDGGAKGGADGEAARSSSAARSASPMGHGFTDDSDWDATMAEMETWATTLDHAEMIFRQLAGDSETMTKEELAAAYKGDEEDYAALYADPKKGGIQLENWLSWLDSVREDRSKGKDGGEGIETVKALLMRLHKNLCAVSEDQVGAATCDPRLAIADPLCNRYQP